MNEYVDLNSISLVETGLISHRKDSIVLRHCENIGIETVQAFLDFYSSIQARSNVKLQINGLVDLLKYKYLDEINIDYLMVLNSKLKNVNYSNPVDKFSCQNDLNLLRRLGLTREEIYSFYNFARDYEEKLIIEIIEEFVKSEHRHLYIGAYLETIFLNKMELICEYYDYNLEKEGTELDIKIENLKKEIEHLSFQRHKMCLLDEKVVFQKRVLESFESFLKGKEQYVDNLVNEYYSLLGKLEIERENILKLSKTKGNKNIAK